LSIVNEEGNSGNSEELKKEIASRIGRNTGELRMEVKKD
jgi:hypothetical protein